MKKLVKLNWGIIVFVLIIQSGLPASSQTGWKGSGDFRSFPGEKERMQINPYAFPAELSFPQNSSVSRGQIARTSAGAIVNYVMIIPILGLGTAAIAADDEDVSPILGGVATGLGAVFIPVASIIAGNPMKEAGVRGSPPLRIVGWITYGLFIADAVAVISQSGDIEAIAGLPAILLGIASTTCLGVDKSMKAMQGRSKLGSATLQPSFRYVKNYATGNKYPTFGVRLNF